MSKSLITASVCATLLLTAGVAVAANPNTPPPRTGMAPPTGKMPTPPAGFKPGDLPALPAGVTLPQRPTLPTGFKPGERPALPAGVTLPQRPTLPTGFKPGERPTLPAGVTLPERPARPK